MKAKHLILCLFCFLSFSLSAQLNIKEKVKSKTLDRVNQRIDEGIDKSLDKAEEEIKNGGKDTIGVGQSQEESSMEQKSTTEKDTKAQASDKLESYSKYDFVPGDKVLFYEDFSQDAIGDFPAQWTTNGTGEVNTVNIAPGNWFHLNGENAVYCLIQNINFPSNFILEFDIIPDEKFDYCGVQLSLYDEHPSQELNDGLYPGAKGLHIELGTESWSTTGYDDDTETNNFTGRTETAPVEIGKVNHVIIWVQNRRVRVYHKGTKTLDMPTNIVQGTQFNRLRFSCWDRLGKPYISNIKVTTAAPDTRSKLLTEGKLVSYGIYFDVNKDVVNAESYGTLNDIAKVLKENPTVRVKIIGHTDSDGVDATNLDLSKRRGASVKNELVKTFGIDASRIESDGKGESEPIAPNDTPANKALNRRVEFIKL